MKIGIGFDVHRLVPGRRLFLGGIEVPFPKGLLGHSDGDVLIHAICDAVLGALSEGDIGVYFPDNDESIKGIESVRILSYVKELAQKRGYRIVNVDAVVVAEEPKISPYRDSIRARLASILEVDVESISVKGKTTEGLGFSGRKEGIEVQAVALLERI
ncbi:MAG TPA: 2-C-methyl-D-erythritol 2,4-cyclodiphosphate synthase [Syntrophorhabdaceae bacterium]|nr:2-C-methyl-D-erythritol 2,4-cyclodiphosphate synthase [Syntrophorhabdaceae bacterium]